MYITMKIQLNLEWHGCELNGSTLFAGFFNKYILGQGRWLRGDTPRTRSGAVAGRSYPIPEARGGGLEGQPHARGQGWQLGGQTPRSRSSGCSGTGGPRGHTKLPNILSKMLPGEDRHMNIQLKCYLLLSHCSSLPKRHSTSLPPP